MKLLIYAFTLTILIASCSKSDNPESLECDFHHNPLDEEGLIDDNEREIMAICNENKFSNVSEIKDNLLGQWEIVGFGAGWVSSLPEPCGILTVTNTNMTLVYQDHSIDTTTTHTWDIKQVETPSWTSFHLEIEPSFYSLNGNIFCEDFFYFNHTPSDGNMLIYKKVE